MSNVPAEKPSRFRFIIVPYAQSSDGDRHAVELAAATARSHAARVSQELEQAKDPLKTRAKSNGKLLVLRNPAKQEQTGACLPAPSGSLRTLDTFVQLPTELSVDERSLLHDYLTATPLSLYRTSASSAFCPVRDITLASIATNEIWLSWVLLASHYRRLLLLGGVPDNDPPFLRRRTQTYKVMNAKLAASEEEALSDETLYGIVAAGAAEHRVGGAETANKHLEAGLTLWEMRLIKGRGQQLTYPNGFVLWNAYIFIGVQNFFKHHETLLTAASSTAQRLRSIQTWSQQLRQLVFNTKHRPEITGTKSVLVQPSENWLKSRTIMCAKDSIIRAYVRQMLEEKSNLGIRTCLAFLYTLNNILWVCRHNEPEVLRFVRELLHYLVNSEPGPVHEGRPQLTCMAAWNILCFCVSNVHQRYSASQTPFDLWDVIRFVELMMLTGQSCQQRMKSVLASWLLIDLDEAEDLVLWDDAWGHRMMAEAESAWRQKQSLIVERDGKGHESSSA